MSTEISCLENKEGGFGLGQVKTEHQWEVTDACGTVRGGVWAIYVHCTADKMSKKQTKYSTELQLIESQ